MESIFLDLSIQEVLKGFRYPNAFLNVGVSEAMVMGSSKKRPTKKSTKHNPPSN